jgi:hypothetical protein
MPDRTAETRVVRAPGGIDTPRCREEAAGDALGLMPHAIFLVDQHVDAAGRLTGPVIYARDFGPRNALLRAEYGRRKWYVYRPGRSMSDAPTFVPAGPP